MKITLYYCDICKKRIKSNQKVWFEFDKEYHFRCKFEVSFGKEGIFIKKHSRKLKEFLVKDSI